MDQAAFRARFPMLEHTTHLASCSLGARSIDLDQAMARMLEEMTCHGAPWWRFEEQLHEARGRFAALIGARPDQVAVVPNVSVGAYRVASTLDWGRRPGLVTTPAEFPSVAQVWLAQQARGAQVRFAGGDGYAGVIDERTGLVSVPLVTYRGALRLPVREVADVAHAAGARVLVDAYQAVGVEPVNVDELGCDYLVAGSLTYLLGLPGMAFLYVRETPGDLALRRTGWSGRADPYQLDFPDRARWFETGTPAVPALYAANAGLALIGGLDLRAVRRHIALLVALAAGQLTEQGERLDLPADPWDRGAHLALVDPDPPALANWLARRRIAVSPQGDVVRLSFHYYSSAGDMELVCEEIGRYRRACL
jgi:selenocysteine lyase/cysteine desulfurase